MDRDTKLTHFKMTMFNFCYRYFWLVTGASLIVLLAFSFLGYRYYTLLSLNKQNCKYIWEYERTKNVEFLDKVLESENVFGLSSAHKMVSILKYMKDMTYAKKLKDIEVLKNPMIRLTKFLRGELTAPKKPLEAEIVYMKTGKEKSISDADKMKNRQITPILALAIMSEDREVKNKVGGWDV